MEAGAGPSSLVDSNEEDQYALASVVVDQIQMPPGFRFHPTDEEIIVHYLLNKVMDRRFAPLAIGEVDLNKCEPWDLPKKAKMGENEWFFFFQKDRKYQTGTRTNRATEAGYWKATGKDKEIFDRLKGKNSLVIGMKKTLVFYIGRAPKGERTNWVMHEYRLKANFSNHISSPAKEEWVVCRVFRKKTGIKTSPSGVGLERINSFVDLLLDSPTLPPLTDYSRSTETPRSSFAAEEADEIKPNISSSKLMLINNQPNVLQHDQKNFSAPPDLKISSHNQYSSPNNLNPNPIFCQSNSVFPCQLPSLVYQHQDGLNSTIRMYPTNFPIKGADQPNSRTLARNVYIGGQEPERMCKMENFLLNDSIISHSQDTGLSNEMTTEITSLHSNGETEIKKPSDQEFEGLLLSPSISDLYSLWSWSY